MTRQGVGSAILTRTEAVRRAGIIRDPVYEVRLDVRSGRRFSTDTTIRFTAVPGADSFIDLTASSVDHVTLNGRTVEAIEPHRITLRDLQADNELVVRACDHYSRTGQGLNRYHDPADDSVYVYTQCQPFAAHRVFPCFDQPDLKARIEFTVLAPPEWTVVSNSLATRSGDRWQFASTPPIPTYAAAVVGGPFHHARDQHGTIPLGLYCRRSLASRLEPSELFTATKQGLDFYIDYFRHPYPFAGHAQVFVPEFAMGGMENAGCVVLDERHLLRPQPTDTQLLTRARVLLHEMAHMWIGNLVTMRWWDDLWLNEALATHLAAEAVSRTTRFTEAVWQDFLYRKARAYEDDEASSARSVFADVPSTAGLLGHFNAITYDKAAALVRQLAELIGPAAFRAGLCRYLRVHGYGTAERSDLFQAWEQESGHSLRDWTAQWFATTGVPSLRVEAAIDADERYTEFALRQIPPTQGEGPREQRVTVGCYTTDAGTLVRTHGFEVHVQAPSTPVTWLVGQQAADLVIPNDDDRVYAKVSFDRRSTATLVEWLSHLPSTLTRGVCWGALWDMTREGDLPTCDWVTLISRHAARERDVGLLRRLLRQTSHVVDQYCATEWLADTWKALADAARTAQDAAEPGSELQLVWARYRIEADPDPSFTRGLLDGTVAVDGLVVTSDLRWHAVIRLATLGAIGEDVIAAEKQRDGSGIADRRAWLAWASLPEPAVKAAAFTAAVNGTVEGEPLSMAARDAILSGFWRPGQYVLLEPYAEHAWAEAVARVWTMDTDDEVRLFLTTALFPACRPTAGSLAAVNRFLERDLPGQVRQIVLDGKQQLASALRAQGTDAQARGRRERGRQ